MEDRLYDLAFAFKKTRLWKKLWDLESFAVRFDDGQTGYVSILGKGGEITAVNVYPGDAGFLSFMQFLEDEENCIIPENYFEEHERLYGQDCIQLTFSCLSEIKPETAAEVRAYAKRNGIRLSGKNAYPEFVRLKPGRFPWDVTEEADMSRLADAVECALWIAEELKTKAPEDLGIGVIASDTKTIPLFIRDNGAYVCSDWPVPEIKPEVYAQPGYTDELAAAKIKKYPDKVTFECRIIKYPEPVMISEGEAPWFPAIFLAVDPDTGIAVMTVPVADYENNPDELANAFMSELIRAEKRPVRFKAADVRTYVFLEPLASVLGADISIDDELPALKAAVEYFEKNCCMDTDEQENVFSDRLEELEVLTDQDLRALPDEILYAFKSMLEDENIPSHIASRLRRILERAGQL